MFKNTMLNVAAIPAFSDNYIWCITNEQSKCAIVIDPGCCDSVTRYLESRQLNLTNILITHHHPDHTAGVTELKSIYNAKVFGFKHAGSPKRKLDFIDHPLLSGDTFSLFGTTFKTLEVPGHTLDHIAFYSEKDKQHNKPWLFSGDTLFSGGCGRLFEGSPEQMYQSLSTLAGLPGETEVFCTHEYTLNNLDFALKLMPNNDTLQRHIEICKKLRSLGEITLPSSISLELKINPFLRSQDPELIQSLVKEQEGLNTSPVSIFAATRRAKDIA